MNKDSGIRNDANDWSEDPRYTVDLVKRVVRESVETVEIVAMLPSLGSLTKRNFFALKQGRLGKRVPSENPWTASLVRRSSDQHHARCKTHLAGVAGLVLAQRGTPPGSPQPSIHSTAPISGATS